MPLLYNSYSHYSRIYLPRTSRIDGDDRSFIDIDVQFAWASDMKIQLRALNVPMEIRNLEVFGLMRITLEPLLADIPIVGCVSITFLQPPELNFQLDGVGAVANLPVISNLINKAIIDVISSKLVLPKRIDIPLTDKITNDIRFRLPAGIVRVMIVQAKDIIDADTFGKSDPYAVVKVGAQKVQTKVRNNTLNPVWVTENPKDYCFDFVVHDEHHQVKGLKRAD